MNTKIPVYYPDLRGCSAGMLRNLIFHNRRTRMLQVCSLFLIVKLWAPLSAETCNFQIDIRHDPSIIYLNMFKFKIVYNGKHLESVMEMSYLVEGLLESKLNRPWSTAKVTLHHNRLIFGVFITT